MKVKKKKKNAAPERGCGICEVQLFSLEYPRSEQRRETRGSVLRKQERDQSNETTMKTA
ncbi:MAG: hypothetical protein K6A42_02930 [Treponema sp.]|nr:hypothetical protein [Treponema sp.]